MTLASQPVLSRASMTVSKTGRPRWVVPPLPGEVPPTILVPYAIACSEWKVPFLPVKPWQITLVFLSIKMDIALAQRSRFLHGRDDLLRGIVEIVGRRHVEIGLRDDLLAEFDIGAFEPYHQRHAQAHFLHCGDDTLGNHVAFHDAAENIDQDALNVVIRRDDLEGGHHFFFGRAAADIKKIGRRLAVKLNDVHGGHGEAGAVDHAADGAVERDIIEIVARRFDFLFVFFVDVAQRHHVGVAVERVVVERNLGIQTNDLAGFGHDQRIDLKQAHVLGQKSLVEPRQHVFGLLGLLAVKTENPRHVARMMRHETGRGIDRETHDLVRRLMRDFFDVHAALGRRDEGHPRRRAINERREIIFTLDCRAFLDIDAAHLAAMQPGLVRDQNGAEHPLSLALYLGDRFEDLDAAGLAAAAGMDLRLHHPDRAAELVGGLFRIRRGEGCDPARYRHAEFPQYRFGLIFVDVHSRMPYRTLSLIFRCKRAWKGIHFPRSGAILLHASMRLCTACADFSNIARSALLRSISTIRSTPLLPITTGTPT